MNKPLASWPEVVLCLAKKIIESLLRGLERAWPALDQTHQIRWHDDIRHFERIGLNRSLLQIFGVSAGQVDDAFAMQCASSFERSEYDDFHEKRSLLFGRTFEAHPGPGYDRLGVIGIVLLLGAAALVKYLFFSKCP